MSSLPTVEQANLDQYWNIIRQLDPELYLIKIAIHETSFNPMVLPKVIRQVWNIASGTKFGKVQIFIQNGIITQVSGEENDRIDQEALLESPGK